MTSKLHQQRYDSMEERRDSDAEDYERANQYALHAMKSVRMKIRKSNIFVHMLTTMVMMMIIQEVS